MATRKSPPRQACHRSPDRVGTPGTYPVPLGGQRDHPGGLPRARIRRQPTLLLRGV